MYKKLALAAVEARESAYAPYSSFKVGAALLTENGKIFTGCNIENAAFSPTVCAERVALFKAVSEGERRFSAIAIAGGGDSVVATAPCGVCRQVMTEFCAPSLKVLLVSDRTGEYKETSLGELLPAAFNETDLRG